VARDLSRWKNAPGGRGARPRPLCTVPDCFRQEGSFRAHANRPLRGMKSDVSTHTVRIEGPLVGCVTLLAAGAPVAPSGVLSALFFLPSPPAAVCPGDRAGHQPLAQVGCGERARNDTAAAPQKKGPRQDPAKATVVERKRPGRFKTLQNRKRSIGSQRKIPHLANVGAYRSASFRPAGRTDGRPARRQHRAQSSKCRAGRGGRVSLSRRPTNGSLKEDLIMGVPIKWISSGSVVRWHWTALPARRRPETRRHFFGARAERDKLLEDPCHFKS